MSTATKAVFAALVVTVLATVAFFTTYFIASSRSAETEAAPEGSCDSSVTIDAYADILDHPGDVEFNDERSSGLTGEYSYALVEMTGDSIPELLVEAKDIQNYNPVRVFSAPDCESVIAPVETLMNAAASAGGGRASVLAATSGDRIYQTRGQSMQPLHERETFALDGQALVATGETSQVPANGGPDAAAITYSPVSDRTALAAFVPTVAAPATPATQAAPAANTVTGTVRVFTGPELATHQGLDRTPNGEGAESTYAVLVPDAPTSLTGRKSGGQGSEEREIKVVLLGQRTPYSTKPGGFDLEGRHVNVSFDSAQCWFPSDASLPVGQPRCDGFAVN